MIFARLPSLQAVAFALRFVAEQSLFEFFNIPDDKYVDSYTAIEYKEPHFHYSLIPQGNWELNGYFQSEKYFKHCADKIKDLFRIKVGQGETSYKPLPGCAVHVRGNDYLQLKDHHYNLEKEYYANAFIQASKAGINRFVVFTDDKVHAMKVLPVMYKWEFLHTSHEITDLLAMIRFENIIMANSSFSWWAAWLGEKKNIFSPPRNRWFGKLKSHYNVNDLYCDNWQIVDYEPIKQTMVHQ